MDSLVKIETPDLDKALAKLDRWDAGVNLAVAKEGYAQCELTMTAAKKDTPVDTGALRASGHVQPPIFDGNTIVIAMGFGGVAGAGNLGKATNEEDVGYAVWVHEDLNAQHKVGKAKFLEDQVNQRKVFMGAALLKAAGITSHQLGG